jgi:phosphoribosyl-AMP cyclohydrolase / phosphoribosyl-ATP pyrophosphohydrolase
VVSVAGTVLLDGAGAVALVPKVHAAWVRAGVRTAAAATQLLDAGAVVVVLEADTVPSEVAALPRERLAVAVTLDAHTPTPTTLAPLAAHVGAVLVLPPASETDLASVRAAVHATWPHLQLVWAPSAAAGTPAAVAAAAARLGADVAVDAALLAAADGAALAEALAAPLVSDRADGLFPTVVTDEHGVALGLVYSSRASLAEAVRRRQGVYQSRKQGLWVKGATSGATQTLLRIEVDCDNDALRFVVHQHGIGTRSYARHACSFCVGGVDQ